MSKFQVGEIAESYCKIHCVWEECEIMNLPADRERWTPYGLLSPGLYEIRVPSCPGEQRTGVWECPEHKLRKRRPPGADIVREFMHELPREVMA